MSQFVIEIQGNALLSYHHNEEEVRNGVANQDYYLKCSYAAVSNVPIHTIMLVDESGNTIKKEVFYHPPTGTETLEEYE